LQQLLLLSGLLCDAAVWQDVERLLAGRLAVQAMALPDCDSIAAMAAQLLREAPEHFALAGHSMGGRVALEMVRQAPQRITRLALLNTGVHPVRPGEADGRQRLLRLAQDQGMAAVAAAWLPPMMGAPPARQAQVLPGLTAMVLRQTPARFGAQIHALLNRPDAEAVLAGVHVPTLLASGTADSWSPLAQHEQMRRQLPQATLVAIENAGHMSPAEQPAAVAQALLSWLGTPDAV
jgi:pimeloyl-ACP methyl ester carboxylesterase